MSPSPQLTLAAEWGGLIALLVWLAIMAILMLISWLLRGLRVQQRKELQRNAVEALADSPCSVESLAQHAAFKPDKFTISRWTLEFSSSEIERDFIKSRGSHVVSVARLLLMPWVSYMVSALIISVLDFNHFLKGHEASLYLIGFGIAAALPLLGLLVRSLPVKLVQVCYFLSCALWMANGGYSFAVLGSRAPYYLVFPGMIFAASGIFLWRRGMLFSFGMIICAFVPWVVNGACPGLACDSIYQVSLDIVLLLLCGWMILVFVGYENERQHRTRYRLRRQLQATAFCIGCMELDSCVEILSAFQGEEAVDTVTMVALLKEVVYQLHKYRPFLPSDMFAMVVDEAETEAEPPGGHTNTPATSDDDIELESQGSSDVPMAIERVKSKPVLTANLKYRYGTVLVCLVEYGALHSDTQKMLECDTQFKDVTYAICAREGGNATGAGLGLVRMSWNGFRPSPQHQMQACRCALLLRRKILELSVSKYFTIAVVAGPVIVGVTGSSSAMHTVLAGPAVEQATRMVQLNKLLGITVLISHTVYEMVYHHIDAFVVDHVTPEGSEQPVAVYEMVDFKRTSLDPLLALYRDGFSRLLDRRFSAAQADFLRFFEDHPPAGHQEASATHPDGAPPAPVEMERQAYRWLASAVSRKMHDTLRDGWQVEAVPEVPEPLVRGSARLQTAKGQCGSLPAHHTAASRPGSSSSSLHAHAGEYIQERLRSTYAGSDGAHDDDGGTRHDLLSTGCSQGTVQVKTFEGDTFELSDAKLGEGGFGAVYTGMNDYGLLVAVKYMDIDPARHDELVNEIKLLSKLEHSNIVGYVGSNIVGHQVMVVMEYVAAGSLAKVLSHFTKFKVSGAMRYTSDILRGLEYLHRENVLHRDIKPENVLLEQGLGCMVCKLSDFGTAGTLASLQGQECIAGTPAYMPPEALRGHVDTSGDIWAVGITLLQMVTGTRPMDQMQVTNVNAYFFKLATMTEPPEVPKHLPPPVRDFLQSCLRLEPSERPSASGLLKHPIFH